MYWILKGLQPICQSWWIDFISMFHWVVVQLGCPVTETPLQAHNPKAPLCCLLPPSPSPLFWSHTQSCPLKQLSSQTAAGLGCGGALLSFPPRLSESSKLQLAHVILSLTVWGICHGSPVAIWSYPPAPINLSISEVSAEHPCVPIRMHTILLNGAKFLCFSVTCPIFNYYYYYYSVIFHKIHKHSSTSTI